MEDNGGIKSFFGCLGIALALIIIMGLITWLITGDKDLGIKVSSGASVKVLEMVFSAIAIIGFLFIISKSK